MAKVIHIGGLVCGFAAGAILLIAGIVTASKHGAHEVAPGKLIVFGLAALAGAAVATADGARAIPQLGIWKVGAKFEGVSDLASLILFAIIGIAIGLSFAFH